MNFSIFPFDFREAHVRWARDGQNSKDDDGHLLSDARPEDLEVAHILPHSLTSLSDGPGNPQLVCYPYSSIGFC